MTTDSRTGTKKAGGTGEEQIYEKISWFFVPFTASMKHLPFQPLPLPLGLPQAVYRGFGNQKKKHTIAL